MGRIKKKKPKTKVVIRGWVISGAQVALTLERKNFSNPCY